MRLQLLTGVASHRERFGDWGGGLWLPECAHATWIDDLLEEAGARLACVDWTDVLGPGDARAGRSRRACCSCRSTARGSTSCGRATATRPPPPTATRTG